MEGHFFTPLESPLGQCEHSWLSSYFYSVWSYTARYSSYK